MSNIPHDIDITRTHDVTIEEIKACQLFAQLSDEEAQAVIDTLKTLSLIAFECVKNDKKIEEISRNSNNKNVSYKHIKRSKKP